jgi:hypothetical protein
MGLVIAVLILALLLGAGGFLVHFLWILAVIVAILWLLGFLLRMGSGRWYRW